MPDDLPENGAEIYIGDGVYASFDGYYVWLRAHRAHDSQRMALEPDVYRALRTWIARYPRLKSHMEG